MLLFLLCLVLHLSAKPLPHPNSHCFSRSHCNGFPAASPPRTSYSLPKWALKKKKWLSGHVSHQLKTLQWFLLLLRMKSELFAMASKVLHDLCPRFPLILSLLLWAFSHYALALQPPCSPPIHSHTRAFGFYFLFAETFPQSSIAQFVLISAKMSFP